MKTGEKLLSIFCGTAAIVAGTVTAGVLALQPQHLSSKMECMTPQYGSISASVKGNIMHIAIPASAFNGSDIQLVCRPK